MTESDKYVILVAFDFSPCGELALEDAFVIAGKRAGAKVHVVNVCAFLGDKVRIELEDKVVAMTPSAAESAVRMRVGKTAGSEAVEPVVKVLTGTPADEVVRHAAQINADLVVVGTHARRGVARAILGSVAERIVRHAHCPVLVTRPKDHSGVETAPGPGDKELGIRGAIL